MATLTSIGFPLTSTLLAFTLIACSSSGNDPGDDDPTPDAPVATPDGPPGTPDAPAGTAAVVVPCAGATIAGDVWFYDGIGYIGSALNGEFPVGAVVQFHDMATHTADHVQGLFNISGDEPVCVRFDALGTYQFRCYFHGEESGAIKIVVN